MTLKEECALRGMPYHTVYQRIHRLGWSKEKAPSTPLRPSHGKSSTPEYGVWEAMKARCKNPKDPSYINYGGQGISVCERWESFENFAEDMGPRPEGGTLERLDNNGNYEPDNCAWKTRSDQLNNTRRTRRLTYMGRTMSLTQWALEVGISRDTLSARLRYGWSLEDALTKPVSTL